MYTNMEKKIHTHTLNTHKSGGVPQSKGRININLDTLENAHTQKSHVSQSMS